TARVGRDGAGLIDWEYTQAGPKVQRGFHFSTRLPILPLMRSAALLLLLSHFANAALAQSDSTAVTFFPDRSAFLPFIAHHEEPRMALQQELGSSRLRISIGAGMDVLQYTSGQDTMRWGAEMCAYALSSTIQGVLFKIAAADGLFGMHVTYTNDSPWSARFRAVHLSAHLVDGSYDLGSKSWSGGREPFNYTRNYGEVAVAYSWQGTSLGARLYTGISYAVWVRPKAIRPLSTLHGVEITSRSALSWYLAYNFSVLGIPAITGSNNVEAGVRFGQARGAGVRFSLNYYNGLEVFGALFDRRVTYAGAGAALELP
ncbi:MAG: DUF1207 domain-containing protein, partial [Bacteroidota bacterium]